LPVPVVLAESAIAAASIDRGGPRPVTEFPFRAA
jgi:hypothetical protein